MDAPAKPRSVLTTRPARRREFPENRDCVIVERLIPENL